MNNRNNVPFSNFPQNFNRTMQIVEPTYEQHIIKPPELNITSGRIPNRLIIDSAERNCKKYPNSNDYVIHLQKEYKQVISVELVQGCIPYSGYIINKNNNKLFLQEIFDNTVQVEVPEGDYNADQLRQELENALNSSPDLDSMYTVSINELQRKFTIESNLTGGDNIFRLMNNCCTCNVVSANGYNNCNDCDSCPLCRKKNCNKYIPKSISKKLGYDKVNFLYAKGVITSVEQIDATTLEINACNSQFTKEFAVGNSISFANLSNIVFVIESITDDLTMTITGTSEEITEALGTLVGSRIHANKYQSNFAWDLDDEKFVIIEIEHLEHIDSNNKSIDNSFGVIFFLVPHGQNNIIVNGRIPRRGVEKYFNPPEPKIDRLRIRFLTAGGELYDFNGRDHVLELEVISLNQPGKYNTLITT